MLAHHEEDQAETVFLRLAVRAAGAGGRRRADPGRLAALARQPRARLEAAVKTLALTPVVDPSNEVALIATFFAGRSFRAGGSLALLPARLP